MNNSSPPSHPPLRDGGPLFWKAFESNVISHLTQEHRLVQFLKYKLHKQYHIFLDIMQNEEDSRLNQCNSCGDFFWWGESDDTRFICDCGTILCGDDDCCDEDSSPVECDKCEDWVCSSCILFCNTCEEMFCSTCVPQGEESELIVETDTELFCYCSLECKERSATKKIKRG